jgi:DNA-directed RNA polymerase subunit RPC12/RpoP
MDNKLSKHERMELRKAIGNRVVEEPKLPPRHRGPEMLVAHACFDCRKSWKLSEEISRKCPQCGGGVFWMGRAFKTPKKTDDEQWQKVEVLRKAGFAFFSHTRWREAEPYPKRLQEVGDFIQNNPNHPFRVIDQPSR